MVLIKFLGSLTVLFCSALADRLEIYTKGSLINQACSGLLADTALYVSQEDDLGYCNTDAQQALGSMAICLKMMPSSAGIDYFLKECSAAGLTATQFEDAYKNATKHMVNVTADPSFNLTKPYYKPAELTQDAVNTAWESTASRFYNMNLGSWFGISLMCYWFFVIFVSGICKFIHFAFPSVVKSLKGKVVNNYRKFVSLPPTGRKDHASLKSFLYIFVWMVPTRLESILIAGWFIMALVFNVVRYNHQSNNLFWPGSESAEMGRKIADRTGIMVLYLIPTLILFAGRNNFLQWFSGWSYSRFLIIHRWIARAAVILVILHAVGMTFNGKGIGKYEVRNTQSYVRWGYVALVVGCLMCFHSLLIFRRSHYELFLLSHIIFAAFFVIGGWRHTSAVEGVEFFYAASAVWIFDRVVRFARLAVFGIRTATVQLKANETLKVTVERPTYWIPFPGCHAFIHFVRPTCFWQSHPFTIIDSVNGENTITFYLKVKGGMTHGLYQYLSNQPGNRAQIKVVVEGPYGQRLPISRYENAVMIAGGNGIPGIYYEATSLENSKITRSVKLYYVIRHYRSLEWFFEELLKLKDTKVQPIIYVTQPHLGLLNPELISLLNSSDDEEDEQEKKLDAPEESADYVEKIKRKLLFIEFREGRPDIKTIVEAEITQADGAIGFVTCAHASMVDEARLAVANNLSSTTQRVDLFEQIQNW
ncbi:uncharacterized protein PRCAT00003675001 [Priceomyces carsonii]|uniref:uncharacterized protein n=1 Tax=Priceomyces carsonii TaxID=28549 RepID=UPI002ED9C985|nr:unnamed protein product [Priceomyces carsonii]